MKVRDGQVIHQMHCSDILQAVPNDGSPGLMQVIVAALLGSKNTFFTMTNILSGLTIVHETESKEKEGQKRPLTEAELKESSSSQTEQKRTKRTEGTACATQETLAELSVS